MSGNDAAAGGVQLQHNARLKADVDNNLIPISIAGDLNVEGNCTLNNNLHNQIKHFIRLNMSVLWQRWDNIIDDNQLKKHIRKLPTIGWENAAAFKEKRIQDHQKYLAKIKRQKFFK